MHDLLHNPARVASAADGLQVSAPPPPRKIVPGTLTLPVDKQCHCVINGRRHLLHVASNSDLSGLIDAVTQL